MNYICANLNEAWLGVRGGCGQGWWCILIMTIWGRGTFVTYQMKTFGNRTITQSVHKVRHWGNNDQKQLPFYLLLCAFKYPKPSCLGSHTDLLALVLHTAPYYPPGHNKHKCLESPEWKLGLFFKTGIVQGHNWCTVSTWVLCSMN